MQFCKMHGLGNDFILLQEGVDAKKDYSALAKKLCDRNTGIGADGILVVLPSRSADVQMRIINSDGSEPDMCGNGVRCFAKYVFEHGLVDDNEFAIETHAGIIRPMLTADNRKVTGIRIDMGEPVLNRSAIPMLGEHDHVVAEEIAVDGRTYTITSLLMGVPHTMIFVDQITEQAVKTLGPKLEKHPLFPEGTNVNFVEVINEREIKVRTWERGAGPTLACGTGACASVMAGILNRRTTSKVTVHLALGDLVVEQAANGRVYMSGPAEYVFDGQLI